MHARISWTSILLVGGLAWSLGCANHQPRPVTSYPPHLQAPPAADDNPLPERKAQPAAQRLRPIGANATPRSTGAPLRPATVHDVPPGKTTTLSDISTDQSVTYQAIYRSAVVSSDNGNRLDYDFGVASGINPESIGFTFSSPPALGIDAVRDVNVHAVPAEPRRPAAR
jgi:hypothetical protein